MDYTAPRGPVAGHRFSTSDDFLAGGGLWGRSTRVLGGVFKALVPALIARPLPASLRKDPASRRAEQVRATVCGCWGCCGSGAGRSPTPSPGHSQALACGDMSVVTGGGEAVGGSASVFFQIPCGGTGGSPGSSSSSGSSREDSVPVTMVATAGQVQQQQRHHQQGKVTVKYDHKELRKRLVLEEWIVEQLGQLYGCEVPGHWLGAERAVSGSLLPLCAHPGIFRGSGSQGCTAPGNRAPGVCRCVISLPGCPLAPGRSVWDTRCLGSAA